MPPPIRLYSELHPHIRQLALAASLPTLISTPEDWPTSAHITNSGTIFTLRHGKLSATLRLPAAVKPGEVELAIPPRHGQEPSWRLALADEGGSTGARARANGTAPGRSEPWSAVDLVAGSEVRCRGCEAVVVGKGKAQGWKDLPSEGWAEMMDFWHCHKPHDHNDGQCEGANGEESGEGQVGNGVKASEESLTSRAYGANSAILARTGVGFVGLMKVMFEEGDVEGVVYSLSTFSQGHSTLQVASSSSPSQRKLNIFCSNCHTQLGYSNPHTSSTSLLKWAIHISSSLNIQPTLTTTLVAALVVTHARSGSAKSLVLPYSSPSNAPATNTPSSPHHAIHIWLFNARTRYASNATHTSPVDQRPVAAARVFFRVVSQEEAERMVGSLDGKGDDAQEIEVPEAAVTALVKVLEESNGLLPSGERQFKEWRVGLLERWDDEG